jgi:hypothetical protein
MMVAAVGIFSLSQWPIIALRVSLCRSISGGEQNTANLRMEVTAACVALETIDEGHTVTIYSDSSYLINCMRRSWYKEWRENDWLNHLKAPVARPLARTRPGTTGLTRSPWPQSGRLPVTEQAARGCLRGGRRRNLPGKLRNGDRDRIFGRFPASRQTLRRLHLRPRRYNLPWRRIAARGEALDPHAA